MFNLVGTKQTLQRSTAAALCQGFGWVIHFSASTHKHTKLLPGLCLEPAQGWVELYP